MQPSAIAFFRRLAAGLAAQFGPGCEIAVHDLECEDPEASLVVIENGQVSGRKVGDGPSKVVLDALREGRTGLEDRLAYLTRTHDGRILKSSSIFLRDEDGTAVGVLSINYDITLALAAEKALKSFTTTERPQAEPPQIARNVNDLLDELLAESVALVGRPVQIMTREDKVKAIRFLDQAGAFLITRSGDKVCRYFGISKFTLYGYLDEARAADTENS